MKSVLRSAARFSWIAVALAVACSSTIRSPRRGRLTTKELVQQTKPAIVRIEVEATGGPGVGTGFVLAADGRIATNLHVIRGARAIQVTMLDGSKLAVNEIAAIDQERDLAIIRVQPARALPVLPLGNSDEVAAGDPVIAIGNPLGVFDYTVSDGLISSVRSLSESLTVLQISAPISQGSSGGPLFNTYGEVIGVATAIVGEGQNINLGIPSNYLRPLMSRDERLPITAVGEREKPATPRIRRRVPNHDMAILDGCSDESILAVVRSITEAIRIGAPLYNEGNHEACYRVYEGTAMRLERELECPGLRDALGQGLLRASTEEGYTLKAWAMRDAFDGVLHVIERKAAAGVNP